MSDAVIKRLTEVGFDWIRRLLSMWSESMPRIAPLFFLTRIDYIGNVNKLKREGTCKRLSEQ